MVFKDRTVSPRQEYFVISIYTPSLAIKSARIRFISEPFTENLSSTIDSIEFVYCGIASSWPLRWRMAWDKQVLRLEKSRWAFKIGPARDVMHIRAKEFHYAVTSKRHIRLLSGHHEMYCSERRNPCARTLSASSVQSVPYFLFKSTLSDAAVFARVNGVRV